MSISPLGFRYRFRVGVGMEAALQEEIDVYGEDHDWLYLASRVPSVQLAASVPGELEAIIKARDEAVSAAINSAYEELASAQTSTEPEFVEALAKNRTGLYVKLGEAEMAGVVTVTEKPVWLRL